MLYHQFVTTSAKETAFSIFASTSPTLIVPEYVPKTWCWSDLMIKTLVKSLLSMIGVKFRFIDM